MLKSGLLIANQIIEIFVIIITPDNVSSNPYIFSINFQVFEWLYLVQFKLQSDNPTSLTFTLSLKKNSNLITDLSILVSDSHQPFGGFRVNLTLGHTRRFIPPPWYKRRGGWGGWNPSLEFLICCSISKRFYLWWKAFDLLNKMRYILWVVALLEACDITNNGRHLGFYQELEIRLKPREMVIFCALHEK